MFNFRCGFSRSGVHLRFCIASKLQVMVLTPGEVCCSTDDTLSSNCQLHSTSKYKIGKNTVKLSNVRNGLSVRNESKLHNDEILKETK